jgi:hypothetical protein
LPTTIYDYEQPYLQAALQQTKNFLLSKDIFWNSGLKSPDGHPPYPQLSVANILLANRRLSAIKESQQLGPLQRDQIAQLNTALDNIHNEWQAAWQAKAELEFGLRIREFTRFLDALSSSDQQAETSFKNGIRIRVLLQLLLPEINQAPPALKAELALHHQRFKHRTQPADFVWPQPLWRAFPPEDYGFLYTQIK